MDDMILQAQNRIVEGVSRFLFSPAMPRRIAVYRFGSLGDCVVALPAIGCIRKQFSGSTIHIFNRIDHWDRVTLESLLAEDMYDEITTLHPDHSRAHFFRLIAAGGYDLYIDLSLGQASFPATLARLAVLRSAGVRNLIGNRMIPGTLLAKRHKKRFPFVSERERLFQTLERHGILQCSRELVFPLKDLSEPVSRVASFLRARGVAPDNFIAFAVKSHRPANCWDPTNWTILARKLLGQGFHVVFVGAQADREDIGKIVRDIGSPNVVSVAGDLPVMDSAAVLRKARLAVSVDTGPMHLAYAVGTRVVALFSARDYPQKWYPPRDLGRVLRYDMECSPCFKTRCPVGNACINRITVNQVEDAIHDSLS